MNKIIVIDGNSLLFRAYYATYNPDSSLLMHTKEGIPTNAIFAFSNMLTSLLSSLNKEDGIFVAFDKGKHTFRHQKYEEYKANRAPTPKDLLEQIGFEHYNDEDLMIGVIEAFNDKELCFLISKDRRVTIDNVDINSFNEWYVHIDSEDMRTVLGAEFTFLHELQHLYKLGHIEEDIIIKRE